MTEYQIDLNDELTIQAAINLGFVPEDLAVKEREQVIRETVIPREFRNDKEYFINVKMEYMEDKR